MPKPAKKTTAKPNPKSIKKATKHPTKKAARQPSKVAKKSTRKRVAKVALKSAAKGNSIIETSAVTWSQSSTGPSFEQVQLAAYHRWLQGGASDLDNWFSAEGDLRGKKL